MAMQEVWIPSPHYSSRSGAAITTLVLHTTEGAMRIRDLGAWFQNPSAGCSSHHGADNYEAGVLGAYVYEQNKAWTQANANPWCLSLEQCAYASWSRDTWLNSKGVLLQNTAGWLAWMAGKYGIPLTVLTPSQAQSGARGVCQHTDLGSMGGGHSDCGGGFPMDKVMEWARGGSGPGPAPTGGAEVAASTAFYKGQRHRACIWATDGKVNYLAPGGSWGGCDPGQTGAKSGGVITIDTSQADPTKAMMVITYVNSAGQVCEYSKPVQGGTWGWAAVGKTNAK